jgi:hypothetical protein
MKGLKSEYREGGKLTKGMTLTPSGGIRYEGVLIFANV